MKTIDKIIHVRRVINRATSYLIQLDIDTGLHFHIIDELVECKSLLPLESKPTTGVCKRCNAVGFLQDGLCYGCNCLSDSGSEPPADRNTIDKWIKNEFCIDFNEVREFSGGRIGDIVHQYALQSQPVSNPDELSCRDCKYDKSRDSFHDKMWCRDCRQKDRFIPNKPTTGERKTRVFGGKEDKQFWSDKPVQIGHPKFKTNFIKKLFCKHNYKVFGAVFATTGYDLARCIKCGKYRKP